MAMTNQTITRRTAFAAAVGAIGTLAISNGKADDESPLRGPCKSEDWGNTWRNPSKARVLAALFAAHVMRSRRETRREMGPCKSREMGPCKNSGLNPVRSERRRGGRGG